MKRILSSVLALFSVFGVAAQTTYEDPGTRLTFQLYDSGDDGPYAVVTGYNGAQSMLMIPDNITDNEVTYPVTKIEGRAFAWNQGISAVTIPSSVLSIGDEAFYQCSSLYVVEFPDSQLTRIGSNAFSNCSALKKIELPYSVTEIGESPFANCTDLAYISIYNENYRSDDGVLYDANFETLIQYPMGKDYPADGNGISYQIYEGATTIATKAFAGSNKLISVTIPSSVAQIDPEAFADCYDLGYIYYDTTDFPSCDGNVFTENVYNNATLYVPVNGLANANDVSPWYRFGENRHIKTAPIENGDLKYEFGWSSETGTYAIVSGPVDPYASSVVIPSAIMEGDAEYTVTEIAASAFRDCGNLNTLSLPASITRIGEEAFAGCYELREIYYNTTDFPWCDTSIFPWDVYNNATLYVPEDGMENVRTTEPWSQFSHIQDGAQPAEINELVYEVFRSEEGNYAVVSKNNNPWNDYVAIPQTIYVKSLTGEVEYTVTGIGAEAFRDNGMTDISLPGTITSIGDYAFYNCSQLNQIYLPESIEKIGDYAFSNCYQLNSIYLPESIEKIGEYAFSNCGALNSLKLPASLTEIGAGVFRDCYNLTDIYIPDTISSIGDYAFYNCGSLSSLSLPASIIRIGEGAFSGCNNLSKIYYNTTEFPWCEENIFSWEVYNNATLYVPVDGIRNAVNMDPWSRFGESGRLKSTPFESNGLWYEITSTPDYDLYAVVSGISNSEENELAVPAIITVDTPQGPAGYEVKEIASEAFNGASIVSAIIGENVYRIGYSAFRDCYNLTTLTLPASVTEITSEAFAGCDRLREIYYNTTEFPWCEENIFSRIVYDDATLNVPMGGREKIRRDGINPWNNFSYILDGTAEVDGLLYELNDNDGTARVYGTADSYQSDLNIPSIISVKNPNGAVNYRVTEIGDEAFCAISVNTVVIGDNVNIIGYGAFRDCYNLTTLTLPASVAEIGSEAFYGCYNLREIYYNTTDFPGCDDNIFSEDTYNIAVLHVGVGGVDNAKSTAPWYRFGDRITDVVDLNLSVIRDGVIYSLYNSASPYAIVTGYEGEEDAQVEISIAPTVESDGIEYKVVKINAYAFYDRPQIVSVTIPASVTEIGNEAFNGCYNIAEVHYDTTEFLWCDYNVFSWSTYEKAILYVAEGGVENARNSYPWSSFRVILDGTELLPESVELVNNNVTLGRGTVQKLDLVFTPEDCVYKESMQWSFDNQQVASVYWGERWNSATQQYETAWWIIGDNYGTTAFKGKTINGLTVEGIVNVGGFTLSYNGERNAAVTVGEEFQIDIAASSDEIRDNVRFTYYNSNIITVTDQGLVTATGIGTSWIEASSTVNGYTYTESMYVQVYPTAITLNYTNLTLSSDQWQWLRVDLPLGESIDNLTWESSDESVVSVEPSGNGNEARVTYVNPGNATVTVTTASGLSATCEVKCVTYPQDFRLDKSFVNMSVGTTEQIVSLTLPQVTNLPVEWTSDDENVATVDENGVITAVGAGRAEITARMQRYSWGGYMYAYVTVTVYPQFVPVTDLSISPSDIVAFGGESTQLNATILPYDATVTDLRWTTSDYSVARVDNNGLVTVVGIGEAVITAYTTDGSDISASCKVTGLSSIYDDFVAITDLSIMPSDIVGFVNDQTQLDVTILPFDASNTYLRWTTSNPAVALVDNNGLVTIVGSGNAVITASTTDGSGITATCNVIGMGEIEEFSLAPYEYMGFVNDAVQLRVQVTPSDVALTDLSWESSDESVATVDESGYVTIVGPGSAVITATTSNGLGLSASCKIYGASGIEDLFEDSVPVDIYNMNGIMVKGNATQDDYKQLEKGVYIIRKGNLSTKVVINGN